MPIQTVIGASNEPEKPDVQIDAACLLLGDWTWEPATSQPAAENWEGPLGSVDLSFRVRHDQTGPRRDAARRSPGQPTSLGGQQPPLWQRLAYLLQPPTDLLLAAAGPIAWPAALFPYQVEAIRTLLARDAILLADDTGLGKTVEAIAALRVLALQRRMQAALLVVPAGLLRQWRTAVTTWAPELQVSTIRGPASERAWQWQSPAHVYLVSYDTLREDAAEDPASPPRRRTWDVVVLDEAQRIKNRDTDISRLCKSLWRRRAWALTGTPIENKLDDLASILEFVAPSMDGPRTRLFAGAEVVERHRAVQLRRRKTEVLPQLPPKLISTITLQLDTEQRASYERAEREGVYALQARGADVQIQNVLELIMRLKQLCNVNPVSGHSAKLADISARLATLIAEGHRALIFTQFTDATFGARAIAEHLVRLRPLLYTGDMSLAQRDDVIRAFKQDAGHRVLILSLRAGGVGLNLQDASYVFHFDRWWNPSVERQAEDRSHRLGQAYPVNVYTYTCEQTIEERIEAVLLRKRRLFLDLVDEVTLNLEDVLTSTELLSLFGLSSPTTSRA